MICLCLDILPSHRVRSLEPCNPLGKNSPHLRSDVGVRRGEQLEPYAVPIFSGAALYEAFMPFPARVGRLTWEVACGDGEPVKTLGA